MRHWPYALPNFMSAVFLLVSAGVVVFGLEEVDILLLILNGR